jgi:hypothetical protein
MKRILLLFLLFYFQRNVQAQVVSISPAVSNPGQTLTTVITLSSGIMQTLTAPNQSSDIFLIQAGDTIFCDYFDNTQIYPGVSGNSDSLYCDFTIPANAVLGWYEVHVITYDQEPIFPFNPVPVDNMLGYGMVVADPNACDVPFNTSAGVVTHNSAQISWDPAVIADTFRVRYRIIGSSYSWKDVDGGGGVTNTTLTGLQPDKDYTFEVSTKCNGYSSAYSIIDTFHTDSAAVSCVLPFDPDTSNVTSTSATLLWSQLATADSFLVRYAVNGTSAYSYVYLAGGGSNSVSVTGLKPGREYKFQVSSVCLGQSSGYCPSFIFITPGPCAIPHSLTASNITNTSALIGWTPLVSGDNFRIRYAVNGTSVYKYKTVGGSQDTTTISGLLPNTTYNYQVSTMCSGNGTGYSPASSFTTTSAPVNCIVPYGLSVSNITSSSVQINWTAFVAADTFRVRYRLNGTGPYFYKDVNGSGGITNTTLTGLLPSSLYTYQVSSVCNGSGSGYSSTGNFTTIGGAVACGIPSGLSATSVTSSTAQINWATTVTADTFRIRFAETGTSAYRYLDVNGSSYSAVISGLTPLTAYDVQVSSVCLGTGNGYSSAIIFGTTAGSIPCATPYDLNTTSILPNSATISWTPDVSADSFMIRYSVQGTTNYNWKKISGAGSVNSTSLTGLQNNTAYQWQVRSICNGVTISVYSGSYSFNTPLVRMANPSLIDPATPLTIFPNPASDQIKLNLGSEKTCSAYMMITDMGGRIIREERFMIMEGFNEKVLETTDLSEGIYILILKTEMISDQKRFIIRR